MLKKLSKWYFGKKVLPFWCILLVDTLIVGGQGTGTEVNPESWTQLKGSHEA